MRTSSGASGAPLRPSRQHDSGNGNERDETFRRTVVDDASYTRRYAGTSWCESRHSIDPCVSSIRDLRSRISFRCQFRSESGRGAADLHQVSEDVAYLNGILTVIERLKAGVFRSGGFRHM